MLVSNAGNIIDITSRYRRRIPQLISIRKKFTLLNPTKTHTKKKGTKVSHSTEAEVGKHHNFISLTGNIKLGIKICVCVCVEKG